MRMNLKIPAMRNEKMVRCWRTQCLLQVIFRNPISHNYFKCQWNLYKGNKIIGTIEYLCNRHISHKYQLSFITPARFLNFTDRIHNGMERQTSVFFLSVRNRIHNERFLRFFKKSLSNAMENVSALIVEFTTNTISQIYKDKRIVK